MTRRSTPTVVAPGTSRGKLIETLKSAVERQQPGRVMASIARDWIRLYAVSRQDAPGVTSLWRWQFQTSYPTYPPWVNLRSGEVITVGLQRRAFGRFSCRQLSASHGGNARVDRPIAAFLRSYQLDGGYPPGPLLAVFALAGLAGSVLAVIRRAGGQRGQQLTQACLLFTAVAAEVLLVPDVFEFSWRYQLPAAVTLPPAGVLAFSAVLTRRRARKVSLAERVIAGELSQM